jgi:hypothetical protein
VDIQLNGQQFAQTGGVCCPGVSDEEDELEESFDVHGWVYRTLGRQSQPINVIINVSNSNSQKASKDGRAKGRARHGVREARRRKWKGGQGLAAGKSFLLLFS